MKDGLESCKSLAEQLGSPYTPMRVGKIRKEVCDDSDMDGKYIKPEGVYKIMQAIKKEMHFIENASPEVVMVRVLHFRTANKRRVIAEDMDTKRKVEVIVPANRKALLDIKGKKFKVQRGMKDGKYTYRYPIKSN